MRRHTPVTILILNVIFGVSITVSIRSFAAVPKLEEGIYLFMGSGCIQVADSGNISLFIPMGYSTGNTYEIQVQTEPKGERLILYSRLLKRAETEAYVFPKIDERARQWNPMVELVPSQKTPGDWDLVYQHFLVHYLDIPQPLDLSEKPLVSFLHKIDNERVVEYLRYRKGEPINSQDSDYLLQTALNIVGRHPGDPFAHLFMMDALIEKKNAKALAAEMAEWRKPLGEINTLAYLIREAESSLAALQYLTDKQTAHQNAFFFRQWLLSDQMDLAARIRHLPEVFDCREYTQVLPLFVPGSPNFLAEQVNAKVALVAAEFFMLQGKREEALQTLASVYRLGQLMNQGGTLITRLIGIAIRDIALRGLRVYALNCVEELAECVTLNRILHLLHQNEKEASHDDLFSLEPILPNPPIIVGPNSREALTRHRVADSRFRTLLMASAAKQHLVITSQFPSSIRQLEEYLPEGIPEDPFSTHTLKFTSSPSTFTCYSVGPDKTDDLASVEYDPTNGTASRGDIFIKVPRERTYPFPRGGVRASTREEILRQFRNGLPHDPFADTKQKSLGITNTVPPIIYSYGPDVNEQEERRAMQEGREYYPDILYDPTNGATSRGDLFFTFRE